MFFQKVTYKIFANKILNFEKMLLLIKKMQ